MLGRLVKVTPSSKVVGDLALHLVGAGVEAKDFEADPGEFDVPDSVIGFLRGELGDPPGGWPEPFRTRALEGRPPEAASSAELTDEDRAGLRADTAAATLEPAAVPRADHGVPAHTRAYGDTSVLSTKDFLYGLEPEVEHTVELEPGVTLLIELGGDLRARRARLRTVVTTLNGQLRPVSVRDRSVEVDRRQGRGEGRPRRTPPRRGPVRGCRDAAGRSEGDRWTQGQTVATIEAMKMEASHHRAAAPGR